MDRLIKEKLPFHIAIIMDGNGRWAKKRLLNRINGHRKGIESVRTVVENCREAGIKYLTLYTFSKENWNRPRSEVKVLMSLLEKNIRREGEDMIENNIRFRAIGNITDLSDGVRQAVADVTELTKDNDGMLLQLALSYSGREEITQAAKRIAELAVNGELDPASLTESSFAGFLYTGDIPDPDLLIRTSGENRISNFLLWQLAYTEIYITDVLWPDFGKEELFEAILDYQGRERRYGLTGEQKSASTKIEMAG